MIFPWKAPLTTWPIVGLFQLFRVCVCGLQWILARFSSGSTSENWHIQQGRIAAMTLVPAASLVGQSLEGTWMLAEFRVKTWVLTPVRGLAATPSRLNAIVHFCGQ
jgi:hypothetical protein